MKKTKTQKGITLVALIITIIVLLILAVVTINAIQNDGIISYAENAKEDYTKAQDEEESILSYYEEYLENKGNVGPWRQEGDDIVLNDGSISLAIGDKVDYEPTELSYTSYADATGITEEQKFKSTDYTSGWQVLGIENGNILLISSNVIKSTENTSFYMFKGKELYLNGSTELNNICAIFGEGNGAQSARSVKVEDINRITGYNPETMGNGETGLYAYGNKITYTLKDGVLSYTGSLSGTVTVGKTNLLDYLEDNEWKTTIEEGESKSFTIDKYSYYATQVDGSDYIEMNMSKNSPKYKLLFDENIGPYFLASIVVSLDSKIPNRFIYGIRHVVPQGGVSGFLEYEQSTLDNSILQRGVRAVVTLKKDAVLEYDKTNDIWNIVSE